MIFWIKFKLKLKKRISIWSKFDYFFNRLNLDSINHLWCKCVFKNDCYLKIKDQRLIINANKPSVISKETYKQLLNSPSGLCLESNECTNDYKSQMDYV